MFTVEVNRPIPPYEKYESIAVLDNNELIAYIVYTTDESTYIHSLFVDDKYRRVGIATQLINSLGNKPLSLHVSKNNESALTLYSKLEFVKHSECRNNILMRRE